MHHPVLHRARRHGALSGTTALIFLLGTISALLIPALVLDFGAIFQLLVSRGLPPGAPMRPWIGGGWPFYGSEVLFFLFLIGLALLLALLEAASVVILERATQTAALQAASSLRSSIHHQTFRLGPHELLDVTRSRPEELFSEKTEVVRQGIVAWYQAVPRALVALATLLGIAVAVNFWLTLVAVLLVIYSLRIYSNVRTRTAEKAQHWHQSAGVAREGLLKQLTLAPLRVGYELETPSEQAFDNDLRTYAAAELRAHTSDALMGAVLGLLAFVVVAFLLLIVGLSRETTIVGTVLIGTTLLCTIFPARRLYQLAGVLATAEKAAAEIFAFLDREPAVHEEPQAYPLDRLQNEIKLEQVTLTNRAGRQLLQETSLNIPAGSCAALLASDRQTAIALAGLFVRFYDPAAGRVLYDGDDIREATLESLRTESLFVPGDGLVFAGSVTQNVKCSNNSFTNVQITDALKVARAFDFAEQLPDQLDTQLAAFDPRLTPHQAFRLGLARALVRDPSVLVIQEPNIEWSDDDSQVHEEVMHDTRQGRTVIIVPSRIASLRTADAIHLFHKSHLYEQGVHADLLRRSELYRHLMYIRFNAFRGQVEW